MQGTFCISSQQPVWYVFLSLRFRGGISCPQSHIKVVVGLGLETRSRNQIPESFLWPCAHPQKPLLIWASFMIVLNSSLAPKPIKGNLFAAASWVLRVALEMCPILAFGMARPSMLEINGSAPPLCPSCGLALRAAITCDFSLQNPCPRSVSTIESWLSDDGGIRNGECQVGPQVGSESYTWTLYSSTCTWCPSGEPYSALFSSFPSTVLPIY